MRERLSVFLQQGLAWSYRLVINDHVIYKMLRDLRKMMIMNDFFVGASFLFHVARASPTGSREDGCNGFQGVSRLSGLSLQGFSGFLEQGALEGFPGPASTSYGLNGPDPDNPRKKYPFEIQKAIHNVKFIQTHMQRQDEFDSVRKKRVYTEHILLLKSF